MRETIAEVVVKLIAQTVPATPRTVADFNLPLSDQGLDSLDHSALLLAVEERYGIKIPDSDVDRLDTVNRIAVYISERAATPGAK